MFNQLSERLFNIMAPENKVDKGRVPYGQTKRKGEKVATPTI